MKRNISLTLIAFFTLGTLAQAQKRHATAKKQATTQTSAQPEGTQPAPSYQDGQIVAVTICKGGPIPEGYVTAGETTDSSCPNGTWLLKKKGTRLVTNYRDTPRRSAPVEGQKVSLKQVSTDLINYLHKPLTVTGYLELSNWYFGPYVGMETDYYAFLLSDESGESANVYVRRSERLAVKMRELLLSGKGGNSRARGKFTFVINGLDDGKLSGYIYADLISAEPADDN